MAYARFSDSDVYVYESVFGGVDCCACPLAKELGSQYSNVMLWSTDEVIAHMRLHRQARHDFPVSMLDTATFADVDYTPRQLRWSTLLERLSEGPPKPKDVDPRE